MDIYKTLLAVVRASSGMSEEEAKEALAKVNITPEPTPEPAPTPPMVP